MRPVTATLHITNGDGAGDCLLESLVAGDVLVCRDVLYTGNRSPGRPNRQSLKARSHFFAGLTGGGKNSASPWKFWNVNIFNSPLPQWTSRFKLEDFKIEIVKNPCAHRAV